MKLNWNVLAVAVLASGVSLITAGCASQTCHPQPNFVSETPTAGAKVAKEPPLQLAVTLTNGTRLIGTMTFANLPLRSEALGPMTVAFGKVSSIKFSPNHEFAIVSLTNGDKLQGSLGTAFITLHTLVGIVTIPMASVNSIQVRRSEGKFVEWDVQPFPRNSTWTSSRGEPATINDGEITIRGQPVSTKQSYSAPMTFECEFTVDQQLTHLEYAAITFIPEIADPSLEPPTGSLDVLLQYEGTSTDGGHLYIQRRGIGAVSLAKEPFELLANKPYHLRVEVLADALRIILNGRVYEAEGVILPFKSFNIRLYGWKPDKVWHVRNIMVY